MNTLPSTSLELCQHGTHTYRAAAPSGEIVRLGPQEHSSFHWPTASRRQVLHVRISTYGWCWSGYFSPYVMDEFALRLRNQHTHTIYLLRVIIKEEGPCTMIYFLPETPKVPPYRLENFSLETLLIQFIKRF